MLLGFSTGAFHKFMQPISKDAIDLCKKLNCQAIELNCTGGKDLLNYLKNISKKDLLGFQYISLHTPGGVIYKNNSETKQVLNKIQEAHNRLNFACVVIHPDLVEDWSIFDNYSFKIGIENMDQTKSDGRTFEEFFPFLRNKKYNIVMDLNHCYTVDNTMKITDKFYQAFKNRISEFHISGYIKLHEPLYTSKRNEILETISSKNIPIIIESELDNLKQIEKEYKYILNYLNKKLCLKN